MTNGVIDSRILPNLMVYVREARISHTAVVNNLAIEVIAFHYLYFLLTCLPNSFLVSALTAQRRWSTGFAMYTHGFRLDIRLQRIDPVHLCRSRYSVLNFQVQQPEREAVAHDTYSRAR